MTIRFLLTILITLLIFSQKKRSNYEPSARVDPYKIYEEGLSAFTKMIILSLVKSLQKQNKILKILS